MELNGYYFRGILKRTRRRFHLSAAEQAYYQELVDISNEEGWQTTFQVSNGELTSNLNCTEKTLITMRASLINAGLIEYNSGKSKRCFGTYTLTTTVTTAVNITANEKAIPIVDNTANPSDYNKLKENINKTKQNTISEADASLQKSSYDNIEKSITCISKYINENKPTHYQPYMDLWNMLAAKDKGVAGITKMSSVRQKKLALRLKEKEFDFVQILKKVSKRAEWVRNGSWLNFDWIIENDSDYLKVIEGKYDEKEQSGPGTAINLKEQQDYARIKIRAEQLVVEHLTGDNLTELKTTAEYYEIARKELKMLKAL